MDEATIRVIAGLARRRAERSAAANEGDGLTRLGATRALHQLAADLEASADAISRPLHPSR